MMTKEQAKEWINSQSQTYAGQYRQTLLAIELGILKAMNITVEEYYQLVGGCIKLSIPDRKAAVKELRKVGKSQRQIAEVLGVSKGTVQNDLGGQNCPENADLEDTSGQNCPSLADQAEAIADAERKLEEAIRRPETEEEKAEIEEEKLSRIHDGNIIKLIDSGTTVDAAYDLQVKRDNELRRQQQTYSEGFGRAVHSIASIFANEEALKNEMNSLLRPELFDVTVTKKQLQKAINILTYALEVIK